MSGITNTYAGLTELKESLEAGRPLDVLSLAILESLLGSLDTVEEDLIFKSVRSRVKMKELKNEPIIQDVIQLCDRIVNGEETVVSLKSKADRTFMYGGIVNMNIRGKSGNIYTASVITDVYDIVTNNQAILDAQARSGVGTSALKCLMDSNDDKLILNTISSFATDKISRDRCFESLDDFFAGLEDSDGFVVIYDEFTIVVYSAGEEVKVKVATDTGVFQESDPTVFDLLFK